MNRLGLIFVAVSALAWQPVLAADKATTYRWVDESGKVHYGDSIPASQADLGHKELDSLGRTRATVERTRLSPAERQQKAEQELRHQEEKRREAEQNRHDHALLSTYTGVDEIDLARDRAIALEGQQLKGLQAELNLAQDKYATANKKITQSEALDQIPSANLVRMRKEASVSMAQYKALIEQREKIIAQLKAQYEADKKRYIELKANLAR